MNFFIYGFEKEAKLRLGYFTPGRVMTHIVAPGAVGAGIGALAGGEEHRGTGAAIGGLAGAGIGGAVLGYKNWSAHNHLLNEAKFIRSTTGSRIRGAQLGVKSTGKEFDSINEAYNKAHGPEYSNIDPKVMDQIKSRAHERRERVRDEYRDAVNYLNSAENLRRNSVGVYYSEKGKLLPKFKKKSFEIGFGKSAEQDLGEQGKSWESLGRKMRLGYLGMPIGAMAAIAGHPRIGLGLGAAGLATGYVGERGIGYGKGLQTLHNHVSGQATSDEDWHHLIRNNPSGSLLVHVHPNDRPSVIKRWTEAAGSFHKTSEDLLVGGKGDGHKISEYPKDEVREGRKVEREHTKNPEMVDEIVTDHEQEDIEKGINPPTYYKRLKKVEGGEKTAFAVGFERVGA